MDIEQSAFNQIGLALSRHFESLYYVNIETGSYYEFGSRKVFEGVDIPAEGDDFFKETRINAPKCVHPDDMELFIKHHDKDYILARLAESNSCSVSLRLILQGKITHMRHYVIMCDDKKHIICCLENIDEEVRQKNEQEKDLQSARRMARLDLLTGVRNKNAFGEYSETVNSKLRSGSDDMRFSVVMCDINDLKLLNDTRGHSFGDEAIQRTSRMICEIFTNSNAFRIGGDEFVIILEGEEYDRRDELMAKLREEALANKRLRSGPVVASGMAVFDPETDICFDSVFQRADMQMYQNKIELKSVPVTDGPDGKDTEKKPITDERKRKLDSLFGAIYTTAGEGYVFLNDLRHDLSRWSLPLVYDFGMHSEYMYKADSFWQKNIHPDDIEIYREAVDALLYGKAEFRPIHYRARRADGTYVVCSTRGFVLSDNDGVPEYFGGIIVTD